MGADSRRQPVSAEIATVQRMGLTTCIKLVKTAMQVTEQGTAVCFPAPGPDSSKRPPKAAQQSKGGYSSARRGT